MKQLGEIIRFWEAHHGQPLALATLVAAHGSSYRCPGARMLINARGDNAGGVSAGCIEDDVIACAAQVLRTGAPQLLTFDTRLRFGCHGAIDILVEPLSKDLMPELRRQVTQRQTCQLVTSTQQEPRGTRIAGFDPIDAGGFTQIIEPVLRLILIGDSSDTVALHAQATMLGWHVIQLASAPVPADLLDDRTAVVLATHNFGRDCTALRDLLPAGLRYLGVIGSRRRREDLLFDVLHNGISLNSSLFAPAGLHLGTESPEEIALSIVAEIQSVFNAGTAEQLRHRKAPIHQSHTQPQPEVMACAGSAA